MSRLFFAGLELGERAGEFRKRCIRRLVKNDGDFVETLIKILISVVIGALVLGLLYGLITLIFPDVQQRIQDLFNFDGSTPAVTSS